MIGEGGGGSKLVRGGQVSQFQENLNQTEVGNSSMFASVQRDGCRCDKKEIKKNGSGAPGLGTSSQNIDGSGAPGLGTSGQNTDGSCALGSESLENTKHCRREAGL